ncbi:hypothetical protein J31TS4_43090 [Paenibacillus sp. J31TS4]|uniref:GldG family protein n=1 Tax=Paenibacillus sp. J31TS4 TaxID=2807195 RepID=UPI001B01120F|nr:GldG family protein [Paenibacillus sp. J31TS4]GIP41029.1 hypothetical protein J31TS4_43090 [Paenibacillus sp. J31TS4]
MKTWIKGTNAAVLSAAVIGVFILLTLFLSSMKGAQWDLTATKKFTLADQTKTVLKEMKAPVHVVAFESQDQAADMMIADLLQEYHKQNKDFTFEQVNPAKQPSVAQKYNVTQYGTIVFTSGDKTRNVEAMDLFGYGSTQSSYTFSGEEKFTQAIVALQSGEKRTAYMLTGHGELATAQAPGFASSLEGEGYELKDLNLVKEGKLPDDAKTLFVLGPQTDLSDAELELLKTFVGGDGKLLFSLGYSPEMAKWKNWNEVLTLLGVKNQNALVVESGTTLLNDPLAIVPEYGYHEIVDKLRQENRITIFPAAMGLALDAGNTTWKTTTLLQSSDKSFGKTSLDKFASGKATQADLKKTDADVAGPLGLAYAIESPEGKPKAIVLGNTVFLQDQLLGQQGNKDFVLNSVAWLHEQENAVTIRPREEEQMAQAFVSADQANVIFIGTVIVIPILFLLAGGLIWWRRRKG